MEARLAAQVAGFMQRIRREDFLKRPGVAETLDWAEALLKLNRDVLDEETVAQTLGCILKYREDIQQFLCGPWADPGQRKALLGDP
jgi:hypothetical protein